MGKACSFLICAVAHSDSTQLWCCAWMGCSQVWGISGLAMVVSASENISLPDKGPLATETQVLYLMEGPGRLCGWGTAPGALQTV